MNSKILIGDLGCTDETIEICKSYDAEVIRISLNNDLSAARNHLAKQSDTEWNFFIEPWECVLAGHDSVLEHMGSKNNLSVSVLNGDVLTPSTRIWHGTNPMFINPVFERIKGESKHIEMYFSSGEEDKAMKFELTQRWMERCPLSLDAVYYSACCHLSNKNWDGFLNLADSYLHQAEIGMASTMIHYYYAMVNCYIKKNHQSAGQHIIFCLAKKPEMAEFWCLLADIYYAVKDYERARTFYENGMFIGEKRLKNDGWPLEVSKYKEYPIKMIEACKSIRQSSKYYGNIQAAPVSG